MKITLVSPYPDITNYGLRSISAYLRQQGHETQVICMPDLSGDGATSHTRMSPERYSPRVLGQMLRAMKGTDLVGISLMTHYYDTARQVTRAVKDSLGVPVVWGGFHASVRPEECIRHADFVVVGEGEEVITTLVSRLEAGDTRDLSDLPGLVWRKGAEVVRNPPGLLEQDLDRFPYPDWSLDDHWVLHEGELRPMNMDLMRHFMSSGTVSRQFGKVGYQTMTGRGCPHSCAYCGNSFTRGLYLGQRYVRYRSVENVMGELEAIKSAYPFVNFMWLSDDSFFGRTLEDFRDFAAQYKKRIGDPFYLLGSPNTITEEKYALMVDAGLLCIQVGIEHGSKRIQKLFRRSTMGNEKILKMAEILARYSHRTAPPHYDIIYDLAYETLEDQLDTLRLIARLPKPYRLQIFSIVYYPGTGLHTLATRDGLIHDEKAEIYDRMFFERHDSYANTILFLCRTGKFPHPLLKFLTDSRVARVMTSDPLAPAGDLARAFLSGARKAKNSSPLKMARGIVSRARA